MKHYFELYSTQQLPEQFGTPSYRMIRTLKDCLKMETGFPGKPYGPSDIDGSFLGLYKRGFLDVNSENKPGLSSWYVTTKGLMFLLSLPDKNLIQEEVLY